MNWFDFDRWSYLLTPALRILLILAISAVLLRFLRKLIDLFSQRMISRNHDREGLKRLETLTSVFRGTASVVIGVVAAMLILGQVGISITPILATAGVAGIAVGFGAQSLVKDFFTGLFLLIENQISEGDIIEAAGKTGSVEEVTLRHIRIRDYDGSVHFIPNGLITTVTNKSREFAYAVIDANVARTKNLDQVFALMREVGVEMRRDPTLGARIVDDVAVAGVEKLEDATVVVRCRMKVMPLAQWSVRREFLKRLKQGLDRLDAEAAAAVTAQAKESAQA